MEGTPKINAQSMWIALGRGASSGNTCTGYAESLKYENKQCVGNSSEATESLGYACEYEMGVTARTVHNLGLKRILVEDFRGA